MSLLIVCLVCLGGYACVIAEYLSSTCDQMKLEVFEEYLPHAEYSHDMRCIYIEQRLTQKSVA